MMQQHFTNPDQHQHQHQQAILFNFLLSSIPLQPFYNLLKASCKKTGKTLFVIYDNPTMNLALQTKLKPKAYNHLTLLYSLYSREKELRCELKEVEPVIKQAEQRVQAAKEKAYQAFSQQLLVQAAQMRHAKEVRQRLKQEKQQELESWNNPQRLRGSGTASAGGADPDAPAKKIIRTQPK
jgi:hypothetical protein